MYIEKNICQNYPTNNNNNNNNNKCNLFYHLDRNFYR